METNKIFIEAALAATILAFFLFPWQQKEQTPIENFLFFFFFPGKKAPALHAWDGKIHFCLHLWKEINRLCLYTSRHSQYEDKIIYHFPGFRNLYSV